MTTRTAPTTHPNFAELLESAVNTPGKVSDCYRAFWNYSFGNQLLAMAQCGARGIQPGPIATFLTWKDAGRFVRKGEKAITLCMPITGKRKATVHNGETGQDEETEAGYKFFVFKPKWFVLAQTDGEDFKPAELPDFDFDRALSALAISRIPFDLMNGNVQGFARKREIAVSPLASHPTRTALHEIAHVVLGHTAEGDRADNGEPTPRNIGELEAEATAMLCCAALGLDGVEESRGYIQSWYKGASVPEASARRIFQAVDAILKAGWPAGAEYSPSSPTVGFQAIVSALPAAASRSEKQNNVACFMGLPF